ncbi:MAG: hypothetical protein GWO24_32690, partial [Akkermansiaceae bacterium]|nr:hypothetical protein [Akkermansiaceae bacterium]
LDRRLSFNVAFFQNDRRFLSDDYDQKNTGGSIALGRALGLSPVLPSRLFRGSNRARLR